MNNVIPFGFKNRQLRVLEEDGEFWFVAKDVAEVLNYSDAHKMTSKLDDDEKSNRQIGGLGAPTGGRGITVINESGLYSVILTSQKTEAKAFKRWVTHEVLPSIRKTGQYSHQQPSGYPELEVAECAARMLRMSDSSKVRMLSTICTERGVSDRFLPDYVQEAPVKALSDLLKEHGASLSARAVNPILIGMGYLEELQRRSSKGGIKKFKSLTQAGSRFGRNETCPRNPRETQPLYYVETFPELLDQINAWKNAA